MLVFWVVMPCGLINRYLCYRGTSCLQLDVESEVSLWWLCRQDAIGDHSWLL